VVGWYWGAAGLSEGCQRLPARELAMEQQWGDTNGGTLTCTTAASGTWTVTSGRLSRTGNASVTFTASWSVRVARRRPAT